MLSTLRAFVSDTTHELVIRKVSEVHRLPAVHDLYFYDAVDPYSRSLYNLKTFFHRLD